MLFEKPLLNKQKYVGSYKAKLNSFMQYCDSWKSEKHIVPRENELRERIPVLHDNFVKSI